MPEQSTREEIEALRADLLELHERLGKVVMNDIGRGKGGASLMSSAATDFVLFATSTVYSAERMLEAAAHEERRRERSRA